MTTKRTGTRKLLIPLGPLAEREMLRVTQGELCLQWGRSGKEKKEASSLFFVKGFEA